MITKEDVLHALRYVDGFNTQHDITLDVFKAIKWYIEKQSGYIPGRVIENWAKIGANAVSKHVKRLEECGAIKVYREQNSYNRYEIGTAETIEAAMRRAERINAVGGESQST